MVSLISFIMTIWCEMRHLIGSASSILIWSYDALVQPKGSFLNDWNSEKNKISLYYTAAYLKPDLMLVGPARNVSIRRVNYKDRSYMLILGCCGTVDYSSDIWFCSFHACAVVTKDLRWDWHVPSENFSLELFRDHFRRYVNGYVPIGVHIDRVLGGQGPWFGSRRDRNCCFEENYTILIDAILDWH